MRNLIIIAISLILFSACSSKNDNSKNSVNDFKLSESYTDDNILENSYEIHGKTEYEEGKIYYWN